MPVYAPATGFADRRSHPRALTAIVLVHAALLAAVMSVKMDLPTRFKHTITRIELIDPPKPPPPEPQPQAKPQPQRPSVIDRIPQIVPIPKPDVPTVDRTPLPLPPLDPIVPSVGPTLNPRPAPIPDSVRVGPRFATPSSLVEPPYPNDKRRLEEEAVLRLRLLIDARGRVVAVEPVGGADRSFLEVARRHLLRHWRYKPATEDGRAVASSTVITLRFRLEG